MASREASCRQGRDPVEAWCLDVSPLSHQGSMRDFRPRVIQARFTSDPDPRNHGAQIRFAAVVLFPPEVKR